MVHFGETKVDHFSHKQALQHNLTIINYLLYWFYSFFYMTLRADHSIFQSCEFFESELEVSDGDQDHVPEKTVKSRSRPSTLQLGLD